MARTRAKSVKQEVGKTRMQLRFDDDVYQGVQRVADAAGISVNQFMQGIARWAVDHVNQGEPVRHKDIMGGCMFRVEPRPGCMWFDKDGGDYGRAYDDAGEKTFHYARMVFWLDLTERSAVMSNQQMWGSAKDPR